MESNISSSYLAKTVQPLLQGRRPEALHSIIAATFLLTSGRKITPAEKKKVIDAFDERFSGKELNKWLEIVKNDLEVSNWLEEHPPVTVDRKRARKAVNEKQGKRVTNISGVGTMVCTLHFLLT